MSDRNMFERIILWFVDRPWAHYALMLLFFFILTLVLYWYRHG